MLTGWQLVLEGDAELAIGGNLYAVGKNNAAGLVGHHIAALGCCTPYYDHRNRWKRRAHKPVTALKFFDDFDVTRDNERGGVFPLHSGDEAAPWSGIGVVGSDAKRIAEVAEGFQGYAIG